MPCCFITTGYRYAIQLNYQQGKKRENWLASD